jgi:hypothetical protein
MPCLELEWVVACDAGWDDLQTAPPPGVDVAASHSIEPALSHSVRYDNMARELLGQAGLTKDGQSRVY